MNFLLPSVLLWKTSSLLMNTDKRLNTVSIKKEDIILIIKSLNPTKANGFHNISIRMIQLCGDSVTLLLVQIFKSSLSKGFFPDTNGQHSSCS